MGNAKQSWSLSLAPELKPEPALVSGRLKRSLPRDHMKAHEPVVFLLSLIVPVPQHSLCGATEVAPFPRAPCSR